MDPGRRPAKVVGRVKIHRIVGLTCRRHRPHPEASVTTGLTAALPQLG